MTTIKSLLLVATMLLAGRIARAQEHEAADGRTAEAVEQVQGEERHVPKPLDNWFSLSFGPGKEHQNGPFAFAIFNFVVLVGLVVRFGRKPLAGYLQQRHDTIRHDLDEAAALHRQAKEKLDLIDQRLGQLDREIADIKAGVAKDADEEKRRIVHNAEAEAKRIVQQTEEILKRELRNAQRRLETEAIESAIRAAEKLVRQNLTDADRQHLNDEYYRQLSA